MPTLQPKLAHREHAAMNPASVMKLLTTYAGLQLLGPDHVWRTRVYTEGRLQGGVLQGQLLLRGGGDPKLVLEQVQALVAEIRAAGVQEVRGDIVLDRSVFEVAPRETPFDDEPLRPYNVAPDGLLMNFGSLIFSFSPDAGSGRARGSGLTSRWRCPAGSATPRDDSAHACAAFTFGTGGGPHRRGVPMLKLDRPLMKAALLAIPVNFLTAFQSHRVSSPTLPCHGHPRGHTALTSCCVGPFRCQPNVFTPSGRPAPLLQVQKRKLLIAAQ